MFKKATCWTVLIYGFIILGLGLYGYFEKASHASLYAGTGLGILLVLSAALMFNHVLFGAYAALALTVALTATFGIRYSLTHKGVPAILAVLSGGMLFFLLTQSVKWRKY